MTSPRLVLASGSPRRRRMLRRLGLDFDVRPVDLDESPHAGEAAPDYVARLADEKAAAAARSAAGAAPEVILAADTVVTIDGELLGKPRDRGDAERMLARLAGRDHEVLTGVAVHGPEPASRRAALARTRVTFAAMTPAEIAWYAATGEPLDKAGAYAIQGFGAVFVDKIDGNYSNVVGLPLLAVYRLLRQAGLDLPASFSRRT
jgi:nucleoside triphosphate pyrophosphatase